MTVVDRPPTTTPSPGLTVSSLYGGPTPEPNSKERKSPTKINLMVLVDKRPKGREDPRVSLPQNDYMPGSNDVPFC